MLPRALVWAVIAFVGIWAPYVLALYPLQLAVQGATLGILALAVGWLRRQTGLLSFGHALFYGGTGYVIGIAARRFEMGTTPAVITGIVAGTIAAFLIGLLVIRASGVAFSMLMLATGMLVWVAVTQNREYTNGYDGLPIRFDGDILGKDPHDLLDPVVAWPIIWIILMLCIGGLWLISRSVFGRRLIAIRENEERSRFIGGRAYLPKVLAFTITGFVGSIAGAVMALNVAYVSPESLFWSMSGNALIVAVIGGVGSVWGPPAGAIAYVFLQAELSDSPYYQLIIGAVLMFVVIVAPGGAADLVARGWRVLTRRLKGARRA
jgi:branched-chain amino acid transport system permease protein